MAGVIPTIQFYDHTTPPCREDTTRSGFFSHRVAKKQSSKERKERKELLNKEAKQQRIR